MRPDHAVLLPGWILRGWVAVGIMGAFVRILGFCALGFAAAGAAPADDRPPQPPEQEWAFVRELQEPLHGPMKWARRDPLTNEVSLASGARLEFRFPDAEGRLETARADFLRFLEMGEVPVGGGFPLVVERGEAGGIAEGYRIEVGRGGARLIADDPEGVRRGLVFLEDEMLRAEGPFLEIGTIARRPVIRTRISRCFFGPIKRPPKNRDELLDDVNYYPDEYLNRLAHEGVNGIWLTIAFADMCRTEVIPEYGQDAERRLRKLRETVGRCGRYGIRVYAFCIEPAALPADSPVLARLPELGGHRSGSTVYFCASTEVGQRYIEQATRSLFSAVPGLGGLINISVGERPTLCPNAGIRQNNCPRCAKREPWEVLGDSLRAMERGMHLANPAAELISWSYLPENHTGGEGWGPDAPIEAAGHVPPGVCLQHNFESGGGREQLGHWRPAADYWLSYVGPSDRFRECARRAAAGGTRMFAKLQVGCSHEVASIPFVPVPGLLYRKYRQMHELGVSGAMQCWYFGNYPSLMNKAAGELSFVPLPEREDEFLLGMARRDWGQHAADAIFAWEHFRRGYEEYPLTHLFQYYGPATDGVAWPLYLEPRDLPLSPTWKLEYPPSGDRIGECLGYSHTLEEAVALCQRMANEWGAGVKILRGIRPAFAGNLARERDIGLAEALGIQFKSAAEILRFYAIRERLLRATSGDRMGQLRLLRDIVRAEIGRSRSLATLASQDPRLGFHSEAEGYKYFPQLLEWRCRKLETLLEREFPAVEEKIRRGEALFSEYTGQRPGGPTYRCERLCESVALDEGTESDAWRGLGRADCMAGRPTGDGRGTSWQAAYDGAALYVAVTCVEPRMDLIRSEAADRKLTTGRWSEDVVEISIEPRRLWPCEIFVVGAGGARGQLKPCVEADYEWSASTVRRGDRWEAVVRIPFASLGLSGPGAGPIRINVRRRIPSVGRERPGAVHAWITPHPIDGPSRLLYGRDNPADLGWLVFASPPPAKM
ncbi:MAG TPA: hypothetical protein PLU30_07870 [Verrucomicrobiae bacterium]|nr:hypothetical protein [Verrucomicrobiae bacterium]